MLAVEMLFLDTIRRRLHLRIDKLGVARHLRHFLQHDRIVDCLCGILTPGKRSVIRTENAGVYIGLMPLVSKVSIITSPVFFSYASSISSGVRFLAHGIGPKK